MAVVPVYLFVAPLLTAVGDDFPLCGSADWVRLADDDPRKWAAVAYAALQHVLGQDIRQEAEHQAARSISDAANWREVARQINQSRSTYIPRRAS